MNGKTVLLLSLALAALATVGIVAPANAATFHPKRCATSQLTGKMADDGGGAAGSTYVKIVLKNTGAHTCTLQGWPGVSFVGHGNGTRIGAPAKQDRTSVHATVKIKPGKTAKIPLRIAQASNYPTTTCKLVPADGFRVYPPGSKKSLYVDAEGTDACSSSKVKLLTVSAVRR